MWIEEDVWLKWSEGIEHYSLGSEINAQLHDLDNDVRFRLFKNETDFRLSSEIAINSILIPKVNMNIDIEISEDEFFSLRESVIEFTKIIVN